MNNFINESLRQAMRDALEFQRNPAYQDLIHNHENLRTNPAYWQLMNDIDRRRNDPSYQALIENINRLQSNPAYQALIGFENNRHKYQEVSHFVSDITENKNISSRLTILQNDLRKNHAEFWVGKDILQSTSRFHELQTNLQPSGEFEPVAELRISNFKHQEKTSQKVECAESLERINSDYENAEKELAENEQLKMFVAIGGSEYRIKSFVAEESNNRIKVFLDSQGGEVFVFFAPLELRILFRKEKVNSRKTKAAKQKVNFLRYKRGFNKKDNVGIISAKIPKAIMAEVSILRIVVASPGDVMAERNALNEVVAEINNNIASHYGLRLELSKWETDSYPGFHLDGPQALIDPILNIEEADIFIGIFWKRFGKPVSDAMSGTEHEFQKAYNSWKTQGNPHIMFYFNQQPYTPTSKAEADQWGRVLEFKTDFPAEGLWWDYNGEVQFEKIVRQHLMKFVMNFVKVQSAPELEEDINEPEVLYSERITLALDTHQTYLCQLEAGKSINYEVSSKKPIDIMVFDNEDYEFWSKEGKLDTYYEFHGDQLGIQDSFTAEEAGDYLVVITNRESEKAKVNVLITLE